MTAALTQGVDEIDDGEAAREARFGGPEWDDPVLTMLAHRLRDAHRLVAPLPADTRRRLTRHLLTITDLAKRDPELAARRLAAFLADYDETLGGEGAGHACDQE